MIRVLERASARQQRQQQQQQNDESDPTRIVAATAATTTAASPTGFLSVHYKLNSVQRRNRPVVLTDDPDGAERCLAMLEHMLVGGGSGSKAGNNSNNCATEETFQIVMRAFLNRGRMRWKKTLLVTDDDDNNNNSNKSSNTKEVIICAADQLELLLQSLLEHQMQQSGNGVLDGCAAGDGRVSMETCNLVLEAYAVCSTPRGGRCYADKAAALVQRLLAMFGEEQEENSSSIADNNGGGNNGGSSGGLQQLPTVSLMHVLHAYAWQQTNLQEGKCASAAASILDDIVARCVDNSNAASACYDTNDATILMLSYHWVLEAWSKSGDPDSAEKAASVFEKMKALNQTMSSSSSSSSSSPLSSEAQSKDGGSSDWQWIGAAQAYSNVILAWSKDAFHADQSAKKAEELFFEMLHHFETGSFPMEEYSEADVMVALNACTAAWGRQSRPDKAELLLRGVDMVNIVRPNVVSYNSVLYAYLRTCTSRGRRGGKGGKAPPLGDDDVLGTADQALEKAVKLVEYMEERSDTIRPNSFTYDTLMKCYIQSNSQRPDKIEQVERLLGKLEQLWLKKDDSEPPSNRPFNMVMNVYAKQQPKQPGFIDPRTTARKALQLLNRMKKSPLSACAPDIISYTTAMECLSKSGNPEAPALACRLLQEAMEEFRKSGNMAMMPNVKTFTMAIQTQAKNHGNAETARTLLDQLLRFYEETNKNNLLLPNQYPYNYVLNCAANTLDNERKQQAFKVATETFQEMRMSQDFKPDSFTYAFWLKCCNNLLPRTSELRSNCVLAAFEECKQNGLVSDQVLTRLFQGNHPELVDQLLELDKKQFARAGFSKRKPQQRERFSYRSIRIRDLPSDWSRNVGKQQ